MELSSWLVPPIQRGIPVPPPRVPREDTRKQVLSQMAVGDSILIPESEKASWMKTAKVFPQRIYVTRYTNEGRRLWRLT